MRINHFGIYGAIVLSLLFVGCSHENMDNSEREELTALFSPETRTSYAYQEGTNFSWDQGDEITILTTGGVYKGKLHPYSDYPTRARVEVVNGSGEEINVTSITREKVAFYPYGLYGGIYDYVGGYFLTMVLPEDYDLADKGAEWSPLPLYAQNNNSVYTLHFRHLCALSRIECSSIPAGTEYLSVSVNNATGGVAGTITMDVDFATETIGTSPGGELIITQDWKNKVFYHLPSGASSATLNVPLIASNYSGRVLSYGSFTVTALSGDKLTELGSVDVACSITQAQPGDGYRYTVDFNPDYNSIPFTIEALESGSITWVLSSSIQYSKNGGTWTSWDGTTAISVVEGDKVQFKGTKSDYGNEYVESTARFNVFGNIMSLTAGDAFESATTIGQDAFYGMLQNCNKLISASNLKLPVMTLSGSCYRLMFYNCTSLTSAPELPATTLATDCYRSMFSGCSSLGSAPSLPAEIMEPGCYYYMFQDCSSLTSAPASLPALTLASSCYAYMFSGCSSLETAPELPAINGVISCYGHMFTGCSRLNSIKVMLNTPKGSSNNYPYTDHWLEGVSQNGDFYQNRNANWGYDSYNSKPSGWTSHSVTP